MIIWHIVAIEYQQYFLSSGAKYDIKSQEHIQSGHIEEAKIPIYIVTITVPMDNGDVVCFSDIVYLRGRVE